MHKPTAPWHFRSTKGRDMQGLLGWPLGESLWTCTTGGYSSQQHLQKQRLCPGGLREEQTAISLFWDRDLDAAIFCSDPLKRCRKPSENKSSNKNKSSSEPIPSGAAQLLLSMVAWETAWQDPPPRRQDGKTKGQHYGSHKIVKSQYQGKIY